MYVDDSDRFFNCLFVSACSLTVVVLGMALYSDVHSAPVSGETNTYSMFLERDTWDSFSEENDNVEEEENVASDIDSLLTDRKEREGLAYTWTTYESPAIKTVLQMVQEGKQPHRKQIITAILDMELHGYQQYVQLSEREKREVRAQLSVALESIAEKSQPREGESALEFVERMITEIHLERNISYQSDMNSVYAYVDQGKVQCQSMAKLVSLLWMHHADHFPNEEWLFIHTPMHVEFGLKVGDKVYSFAALDPNRKPQEVEDKKDSFAVLGEIALIETLFRSANKTAPYSDQEKYLWMYEGLKKGQTKNHAHAITVEEDVLLDGRDHSEIVKNDLPDPLVSVEVDFGSLSDVNNRSPAATMRSKRIHVSGSLLNIFPSFISYFFQSCHAETRGEDEKREGELLFTVDDDFDITLVHSSFSDEELEECIYTHIKQMKLDTTKLDSTQTEYTLIFSDSSL